MLEESNFLKRKPWKNYTETKVIETQILSIASKYLKTLVIGSGLLYGAGEHTFTDLFRQAWLCLDKELAIPSFKGEGENTVPTIHVKDLSSIVAKLVAKWPAPEEEKSYIIAVDKSKSTLKDIVSAISKALSFGQVRKLSEGETSSLVSNTNFQKLQVNLSFNADNLFLSSLEGLEWVAESGLIENIELAVSEFKTSYNLKPLRVTILGPPGCGKFLLHIQPNDTYNKI